MKTAQYLLRLYPRAWRKRYEEEVLAMLEQRPLSFADTLDLLTGACDAHLHPHLGTSGMGCSERMIHMFLTLRRSVLTIFCAYVGMILSGMALQKMTEYDDFQETARTYPLVGLSFNLVIIAAVVALLAVLVGGLPIAVAVVRSALARKRYGSLFLLIVPLLAFFVFLGVTLFLERLKGSGPHIGLFFGTLIVAALVSPAALCLAVVRSEISEKLLRFTLLAFALGTFSMVVILVATILWGFGLHAFDPQLFASNAGVVRTSTSGTWLGIVIAMTIANVVALVALIRGWSARSTLRKATAM
jgi:hypothetical protein